MAKWRAGVANTSPYVVKWPQNDVDRVLYPSGTHQRKAEESNPEPLTTQLVSNQSAHLALTFHRQEQDNPGFAVPVTEAALPESARVESNHRFDFIRVVF